MIKIALFASGNGTNVQNLLEKVRLYPKVEISCVIVDSDSSPLPTRLKFGYPELPVYKILPDPKIDKALRKQEFETRIISILQMQGVEWILLAGYMRIVGPTLLTNFQNKIVNIHPSLLPNYPGLNGFERAYADGVEESGITIHLVDEGMDTGPIIMQKKFPRLVDDSLAEFIRRGKDVEWDLYPEVLKKLNQTATLLPGV